MSFSTLTRYLRLKIRTDLNLPASQNLARLDALGNSFNVGETDDLTINSRGNVVLKPEATAVGGSGSGGEVHIGSSDQPVAVKFFATSFAVEGGAGNLVTDEGAATLTNKSISGLSNLLSNIGYASLNLTGSIKNSDIASDASIADSKLATISSAGKVHFSSLTGSPDGVVFPSYSGNGSKYLRLSSDGSSLEWASVSSTGSGMETYKADWTSGTSITLNHNLGTADVQLSVWDLSTGEPIYFDDVDRTTSVNSMTLSVPSGISPNYRVVLLKIS
jgi:hypothetical protein